MITLLRNTKIGLLLGIAVFLIACKSNQAPIIVAGPEPTRVPPITQTAGPIPGAPLPATATPFVLAREEIPEIILGDWQAEKLVNFNGRSYSSFTFWPGIVLARKNTLLARDIYQMRWISEGQFVLEQPFGAMDEPVPVQVKAGNSPDQLIIYVSDIGAPIQLNRTADYSGTIGMPNPDLEDVIGLWHTQRDGENLFIQIIISNNRVPYWIAVSTSGQAVGVDLYKVIVEKSGRFTLNIVPDGQRNRVALSRPSAERLAAFIEDDWAIIMNREEMENQPSAQESPYGMWRAAVVHNSQAMTTVWEEWTWTDNNLITSEGQPDGSYQWEDSHILLLPPGPENETFTLRPFWIGNMVILVNSDSNDELLYPLFILQRDISNDPIKTKGDNKLPASEQTFHPTSDSLSPGDIYLEKGEWVKAIKAFDQELKENPENASAWAGRGWAYFNLGDYLQAVEDETVALELRPNYARAYNNRGAAYTELGDNEAALSDFSSALESDPTLSWPYINRGNIYTKQRKFDAALEEYNAALLLDEHPMAYVNRGSLFQTIGKLEKALADYNAALQVDSQFPLALLNRGSLHLAMGNIEQATDDIEAALHLMPEDSHAWNNFGLLLYNTGALEGALTAYKQSLSLNPNNAQALSNRCAAYYILEEFDRALQDCHRAVSADPLLADGYYNRALVYYRQNKNEKAEDDLHHFIQLEQSPLRRQLAEELLEKIERGASLNS